jgi:hypothetical protein
MIEQAKRVYERHPAGAEAVNLKRTCLELLASTAIVYITTVSASVRGGLQALIPLIYRAAIGFCFAALGI